MKNMLKNNNPYKRKNLLLPMLNEKRVEITACRSCGGRELINVISFGNHYISDFVGSETERGVKVPLDLVLCPNCKLLQLKHNAPENVMWGEQYWYRSSLNRIIRNNLKEIVDKSEKIMNLQKGDLVLDIGCNDGTMLEFYDKEGLELTGFEPSKNVAALASEKGFKVFNDYFNSETFRQEMGEKKAKLITAISMFYDLEDPNKFLQDIVSVLDPEGVFIIQQSYLVKILEKNAFDSICHEHREYYSFTSLKNLLDKYNLEIFDVELNEIYGGCFRTYIKFRDNPKITPFTGSTERLKSIEQTEKALCLDALSPYQEFASRVEQIKTQLLTFIELEQKKGKTFGGCGASTKGNTILQYFNLTPFQIVAIADANPDKFGKKTVGTGIPVVSVEEMKKINPDYQIVFIWHLFEGLMEKEKEYLKRGGKFILPLPELKIVEYSPDFDKLMVKKFL